MSIWLVLMFSFHHKKCTILPLSLPPVAVRVGFEELTYSENENGGTVEVCAVIDQGQLQGSVEVNIQTSDNTAEAGSDYTALPANAVLTFQSPSTRACTDISITNDQLYEIDEDFFGQLTSPNPNRVTINPARDTTTITILDDDSTLATNSC